MNLEGAFALAISQIQSNTGQNPNASYREWDEAIHLLQDYKIGCAGLNPAMYRQTVKALQLAEGVFNDQHNLLSTATDEERRQVVSDLLDWWNGIAYPAIQQALAHAEGQA